MGAPDLYRYVTLEEAGRRLGIRKTSAVAYLEGLGIVHRRAGRKRVWLADLQPARLAELEVAAKKHKPARRPAANTPIIPSADDLAPVD